ncbi:MAG: DNA polymerase IV [Chitinophagia bacterium]|nr:DNA polymerase IV [Chitinophagia bacterium]
MSVQQSYIAHFDLDAFFVSVERILNPSLEGKPLIIGGSKDRGVVSTCSYEARKFGVHSAMPMSRAHVLCPNGIFMKGSSGQYSKFSQWVTDIIAAKAPLFEKASIDEFYIDLTGMDRFFDPLKWTIDLRNEIMETTRLPISFGLASNRMVAKIATNVAKPNGYIQVLPGKEKEFLAPLQVGSIPGVGEHTLKKMHELGILFIKDLAAYPLHLLELNFGSYGASLARKANGESDAEVYTSYDAKSVSTEHTFFENVDDLTFLENSLLKMSEKLGYELRRDQKSSKCIAVKLRYPDFETHTKQISIHPTSFDDEIFKAAKQLFHQLYDVKKKIRLLGVRCSDLTSSSVQTNIFENKIQKSNLYSAIDDVKSRFGKNLLGKAGIKKS